MAAASLDPRYAQLQRNITTAEPTHCLPTRCEYSPRHKNGARNYNLFKILKAAQNFNKNRVHLTHKNTGVKGKFEKESPSFSIMCYCLHRSMGVAILDPLFLLALSSTQIIWLISCQC